MTTDPKSAAGRYAEALEKVEDWMVEQQDGPAHALAILREACRIAGRSVKCENCEVRMVGREGDLCRACWTHCHPMPGRVIVAWMHPDGIRAIEREVREHVSKDPDPGLARVEIHIPEASE